MKLFGLWGGKKNLPIGNLTSQWMGNVYLNELDHFAKENMRCHAYIRYCDDFLIFSNDKSQLHAIKQDLEKFLFRRLNLTFSKSSVFPTSKGVGFIGYRHFKKFILLRKYGAHKIFHYVKNIIFHYDRSLHSAAQLAALHGWAKWACCYNFKKKVYNLVSKLRPTMKRFVRKKFFVPY